MTIAFSDIPNTTKFIIRVENKFVVRVRGALPEMTNNILFATRFNYYDAVGIMIKLDKLGYVAEMIAETR